jgi:protein-S-isoprenylcysteine O-methyltransferase Ste14
MQLKRNHFLLVGLLLFFLGIQFRLVQSFTLSERSSRFIAAQMGEGGATRPGPWPTVASRKVVQPPRWLGLALMSVGAVVTLKSLSMAPSSGKSAADEG